MALEMEYLLSSDEMQSQRSTVLPPIPAMSMSSMSISAEPHDAGEAGQEPLGTSGDHPGVINLGVMFIWLPVATSHSVQLDSHTSLSNFGIRYHIMAEMLSLNRLNQNRWIC